MKENHFIGHLDGSVSYCRDGEWFRRVWAIPFGHYERFDMMDYPKFRRHINLFDWRLRFIGYWCYMAPDHLARRVDSSD